MLQQFTPAFPVPAFYDLNSKYDAVIQDADYYERWDGNTRLTEVRRCLQLMNPCRLIRLLHVFK